MTRSRPRRAGAPSPSKEDVIRSRLLIAAAALAAITLPTGGATRPLDPTPARTPTFVSRLVFVTTYQGRTAKQWAARYRRRTRQLQHERAHLRRHWQPTVTYALTLASSATGVPYSQLYAVAWCESRFDPYATNGRYQGLFQLGWSPYGMSPFDPVANALSAAQTVVRDGGWREWTCQP